MKKERNKFEEDLRNKLNEREIVPSEKAWDRLDAMLAVARLRILGGRLSIESVLVRANEARVNFRDVAAPRMKGLSAAFHEVQFQAEVRRAHPLSLKLMRLGGVSILDGLVRALSTLVPS